MNAFAAPFWISQAVTFLSALALVSALGILSLRTLHLCIRAYAAQSIFLGLSALLLASEPFQPHMFGFATLTILIKGFAIPWYLFRVIENVEIKKETDPFIGYHFSVLCGIGLALLSYAVTRPLADADPFAARGFALALTLMQLGLWLMVSRRKAITQVVGLLIVENGLFVAVLSTSSGMPMVVELGLVFDLMVAVVVLGLLVFRIHSTFASINTKHLSRLKG